MRPTPISIGDFNERVTFYTQTAGSVDAFGNPSLSLGTALVRWANVKEKQKSYTKDEGGTEFQNEYIITVRKPLAISEGDRVDFNSLECTITSLEVTQSVYYTIKAVAIK